MSYPADSAGLYRWILLLLIGYMIMAYMLRYSRGEHYTDTGHEFMLTQLFNGTTFAGSSAVLWGVMDPDVMKIVGDTTMFLLLAGVAGVLYSLRQLVRTKRMR